MIYKFISYKFFHLDFTFRFDYLYYIIFDIEIVPNIISFISDQSPNSLFSYLNGEIVPDFQCGLRFLDPSCISEAH